MWFVRHVRHRQNLVDEGGSAIAAFHKRRQKSLSNNLLASSLSNNHQYPNERGSLSERGHTALVPAIPYLTQLLACFQVSSARAFS